MISGLMAKRNILNVELVPAADIVLNETAKRTGLAKKDLVARMCAWFASQDLEVQKLVINEIPASMAQHAREIALQRLVGNTEIEKAAESRESTLRRPKVTVGPGEANPRNRPR